MKNSNLMGVHTESDNASNVWVLHFAFEPLLSLSGSMGKRVSIKMSKKNKASDVADALIKAGVMLHNELKKD